MTAKLRRARSVLATTLALIFVAGVIASMRTAEETG